MRRIQVIDDLNGESEAAETVVLALRNKEVELDLCKENIADLEALLAPYFKAGRPVGSAPPFSRVRSGFGGSTSRQYNADTRAWGKENGWPYLKSGGKGGSYIPTGLKKAYAAHLASLG